jgi:hypothetical protein
MSRIWGVWFAVASAPRSLAGTHSPRLAIRYSMPNHSGRLNQALNNWEV